jgi:hypothetical protein
MGIEQSGRDGRQEVIFRDDKAPALQGHDAPLELAPYGYMTRVGQGKEHLNTEKEDIMRTVEIEQYTSRP